MSAEQPSDAPEPQAPDAQAVPEDAAQTAAAKQSTAAESSAGEQHESDAGGQDEGEHESDAGGQDEGERGHAGAQSTPAEEAVAQAEDAPAAGKRRRAPRLRKGDTGTGDEPQTPKRRGARQTPASRARGKAPAAPGAKQGDSAAEAPAPVQRRTKRSSSRARRRVVRARARYVRTSARKARMVCGHLQGKSVAQARAILAFAPRAVARDWSKLLESAVANAENNHELLEEDLIVREAYADEGPTIKRFRPRAMGRATPIRKRTSHLTITLAASTSKDKRAG
jgi:ribosomal protein L22